MFREFCVSSILLEGIMFEYFFSLRQDGSRQILRTLFISRLFFSTAGTFCRPHLPWDSFWSLSWFRCWRIQHPFRRSRRSKPSCWSGTSRRRRKSVRRVAAVERGCCPGGQQVWSPTQFYSVDFLKSRIGVKKCVFNKCFIKVFASCCSQCPGTSCLAWHT